MKITVESTSKMVEVNGLPARVWEGVTESGIPVAALITRVSCPETCDQGQFRAELQDQKPPTSLSEAYPMRLVL